MKMLFLLISALTLGGVFLWHFLKNDQATLKKYSMNIKTILRAEL